MLARAVEAGPIAEFARSLAGAGARATKLTLFNKSRQANWTIRWHQDAMIAVAERREAPGFRGWSEKEGVMHVRPPAHVLESIVALRVHLDDTPAWNGPLRVLPGTHVMGLLDREQIESCRREHREVVCEVAAGGVMAIRPLLLHASSKAAVAASRRVLHVGRSWRSCCCC